jgi:hypothetical protein
MSPPKQEGSYTANYYNDAKRCNFSVNPADCVYYGAGNLTYKVTITKN